MFVHRKKSSGPNSTGQAVASSQEVLEVGDRDFQYMTRESAVGIRPERDYSYNVHFGSGGDDEWARERATGWMGYYNSMLGLTTFGSPSLGTIIKHLKRFDAPDYSFSLCGLVYWVETLATVKKNEWIGNRQRWLRWTPLGISEESLPSFPGIVYRSQGYRTKGDAETAMHSDAAKLVFSIYAGEKPRSRPVALFGRGKRVVGDEVAGFVGCFKAGRLVMAVDGREHVLIAPIAERLFAYHEDCQLSTEIVVGMSFQNRGATVFLFNFCASLMKDTKTSSFLSGPPDMNSVYKMDDYLDNFERHQFEYRYFVLDLSRQDSSIGSFLYDEFFAWARHSYFCVGSKEKKNFGRYFDWIRDFLIHTRIALPDGQIWQKHKGNVSGSPLTTLVNSYTALLAARTVFGFLLGSGRQDEVVVRVYGDNILIGVPRRDTMHWGIPEITEVWELLFGQTINPDESYEAERIFHEFGTEAHKSVSFLGKHFLRGGGVWRPFEETVAAMVAPDSEDKSWSARYARACGLMADNPFNIEATSYLGGLLDEMEDRGVLSGQLPSRESTKFRYKLMGADGDQWACRTTVLFNQMLYEATPLYRTQTKLTSGGIQDALDEWAERLYAASVERYGSC